MKKIVTALFSVVVVALTVLAWNDISVGASAQPPTLVVVISQSSPDFDQTAALLVRQSAKFPGLRVVTAPMTAYPKLSAKDLPAVMLQIDQIGHHAPYFASSLNLDAAGDDNVTYIAKNLHLNTSSEADLFLSKRLAVAQAEIETLAQMQASRSNIDAVITPISKIVADLGSSYSNQVRPLIDQLHSSSDPLVCKAVVAKLKTVDGAYVAAFNLLHAQAHAAISDLLAPNGALRDALEAQVALDNGVTATQYGPTTITFLPAKPRVWSC